jgi:hypothetical protein
MKEPIFEARPADADLPRWVQVPVGLFLGLFTLLCLAGSTALVFTPNHKAPILAPVIGIVCTAACVWALEKCARLLLGKKNKGGLLPPATLRVLAWFFLFLPVGGLVTGYLGTHPVVALAQTAVYVSIFFGLRSLAACRDDHDA